MRRPSEAAQKRAQAFRANAIGTRVPKNGSSDRPVAQTVGDFVGEPRARSKASSARALRLAIEEARAFREANTAGRFRGKHFVGLYAELHKLVYGVEPLELGEGDAFFGAASAADRMLRVEFRGNVASMIEFIRWAWKREKAAEKRRRSDGNSNGFRLGWRLQFASRAILTDYRVEQHRQQAGSR